MGSGGFYPALRQRGEATAYTSCVMTDVTDVRQALNAADALPPTGTQELAVRACARIAMEGEIRPASAEEAHLHGFLRAVVAKRSPARSAEPTPVTVPFRCAGRDATPLQRFLSLRRARYAAPSACPSSPQPLPLALSGPADTSAPCPRRSSARSAFRCLVL
ncbi:DUF5133 domain-containing protein [Streptomyces sp. NPDC005775]|uniref:DUF5133 domain-containing protein n=1 Tax=Streptomyces sp. NPDC005775 TaxID=3364729 RepID=UPI0036837277